ncbi:hypothetical protein [Allokutzneria oryzae]|uniref:Major facilitator superfamily (MFS) profile domain-containing protein n=1 Tax=Allokutzneria oryzae TaxID=1378989 RepID=A0ABV6A8J1_9PSEU
MLLFVFSGITMLTALVLGLGAMLGSVISEIPVAGFYASQLTVLGVNGAALLVPLAALDIVLGVCVARGVRWAWLATIVLSVVLVTLSVTSATPPIIVMVVVAASVVVGLLTVPSSSRSYFGQM